jgi:hypothetical protein
VFFRPVHISCLNPQSIFLWYSSQKINSQQKESKASREGGKEWQRAAKGGKEGACGSPPLISSQKPFNFITKFE